MLRDGIMVTGKMYEFLAFSPSQLKEQSCWFFASGSDETADSIRDWMGDFRDIKCVGKLASRLGQCFSATTDVLAIKVGSSLLWLSRTSLEFGEAS